MRLAVSNQRFRTWRVWRWPSILEAGRQVIGEPALLRAGFRAPLRPAAQTEVPDLDDTAFPGGETASTRWMVSASHDPRSTKMAD